MVIKILNRNIILCMTILYCHACVNHSNYWEIDNPFIRFVNQSDDTVWIEMLSPREITNIFGGDIMDSLFYGCDQMILPNSTEQIMSWLYPHWAENSFGEIYTEDNVYIARLFVMDSCAPTEIDIRMARNDYYKELYQTDSMQVIKAIKDFERNHLLFKHWYSKVELDSMNWTIVYPQNK